jgi:hypothetical protein
MHEKVKTLTIWRKKTRPRRVFLGHDSFSGETGMDSPLSGG